MHDAMLVTVRHTLDQLVHEALQHSQYRSQRASTLHYLYMHGMAFMAGSCTSSPMQPERTVPVTANGTYAYFQ